MPVHTQAHISMYVCVYTLSEFSSFSWGWLFIRSDAVMSALATAYLARLARFDCRLSVCVVWVWGGERHVIAWNCVGANSATVLSSRSCACRSIENGRHYECAPKLKNRLAHCSLTRLCRVKRHLSGMRTSDESRGCRARSRWNSSHLRLALSVLRAAFTWTTLKRNGTHSRTRRRKNKTAVKQR